MELQNGRPASLEGREEKEIKVYDLLDRLGIEYLRTDHEAAGTIADCLEVDQVLESRSARICSCAIGRRQRSIC